MINPISAAGNERRMACDIRSVSRGPQSVRLSVVLTEPPRGFCSFSVKLPGQRGFESPTESQRYVRHARPASAPCRHDRRGLAKKFVFRIPRKRAKEGDFGPLSPHPLLIGVYLSRSSLSLLLKKKNHERTSSSFPWYRPRRGYCAPKLVGTRAAKQLHEGWGSVFCKYGAPRLMQIAMQHSTPLQLVRRSIWKYFAGPGLQQGRR